MNQFFSDFDLTGKTAMVTGGATGLGYQMARALARAGAHVIIVARRSNLLKDSSDQLNKELDTDNVSWFSVDLLDRKSIANLIDHVESTFDGLDIFVGNAGATIAEPIPDIQMENVDKVFQLNVHSNIELAKAFLPYMRSQNWGRIILSSSIGSVQCLSMQGTLSYNATKAAINSLARSIAGDMGHYNITANAIVLGFFMTDILTDVSNQIGQEHGSDACKAFLADFIHGTAVGRIGDPAEIQGLINLLASDAGSYITGASIPIDGGMSIMMRPLPIQE